MEALDAEQAAEVMARGPVPASAVEARLSVVGGGP
jgi:hypothetical protein